MAIVRREFSLNAGSGDNSVLFFCDREPGIVQNFIR